MLLQTSLLTNQWFITKLNFFILKLLMLIYVFSLIKQSKLLSPIIFELIKPSPYLTPIILPNILAQNVEVEREPNHSLHESCLI